MNLPARRRYHRREQGRQWERCDWPHISHPVGVTGLHKTTEQRMSKTKMHYRMASRRKARTFYEIEIPKISQLLFEMIRLQTLHWWW